MISDCPAVRSCRHVLLPVIHLVVTTVSEKVYASDEYDYIRDETASKEKKSSLRRPNIIFIFQDDLGFGDVSCYSHPCDLTPRPRHMIRVFRSVGMDPCWLSKASFAVICPIAALTVVYYGSRGSFWQMFIFEGSWRGR